MPNRPSCRSSPRRWALSPLLLLPLLLTGCGHHSSAVLTLHPLGINGGDFTQTFPRSYLSTTPAGDYDIVLIQDGLDTATSQRASKKPNAPLRPIPAAPLKQVVHIRLLWRALGAMQVNQPTSTNATINWIVLSTSQGSPDRIEYQGGGYVRIYPKDNGAEVVIRNATLSLKSRSGQLTDPIGRSTLTGSFYAERNEGQVRDVLDQTRPSEPVTPALAPR